MKVTDDVGRTTIARSSAHGRMPIDAIIEWDVRNWARCLDYWAPMVGSFDPGRTRVLTIGERNGGLSLWFALLGFQVVCTDRGGPRTRARALHDEYRASSRVQYEDVDVFRMPFATASFDIVACKSVLGGLKRDYRDPSTRSLEGQAEAVHEIHRVIRPGGCFLGAENLAGSPVHRWLRERWKGGKVGWRHPTLDELSTLFSGFPEVELQPYGVLGSQFTRLHLDRLTSSIDRVLSGLVHERWNYIAFIRARR